MTSPRREKAAPGGEAALSEANQTPNSTLIDHLRGADPLIGWFGLAAGVKASKLRQMKRGWQRKGGK
jgi:hypothetical protein